MKPLPPVLMRTLRPGLPRPRFGYTLLELLLSLALTVVVVAGIAQAINLYFRVLTRQQQQIEQDLVGRAVLTMMANDLRAALQYKAADVSGIENLSVTEALTAGLGSMLGGAAGGAAGGASGDPAAGDPAAGAAGGGATGGGVVGGGATGGGATGGAAPAGGEAAAEEEDPAEQDNAWYRPAFVGLPGQLTVDVSRLPRLDQYSQLTTGLEATSTPSDIKRVAWLVSLNGGAADPDSLDPVADSMGGLYRREVDRAASAYRKDPDSPSQPDEYSKLIAPEVVSMQFRYFDGTDWKTEWASEDEGGFPLAVEITLLLDSSRNAALAGKPGGLTGVDPDQVKPYRLVVNLPSAEIIPEEEGAAQ